MTFDADYLALHISGVQHADIAWCTLRKYSVGELIQLLMTMHGVLDRDEMRNRLEYL